jgi:hypothetical protein
LDRENGGAKDTFLSVAPLNVTSFSAAVPWQIVIRSGGSEFTARRAPGVAARVHLKGWGSGVVFDDQTASGDARLQSPNYEGAARRYDIEVTGTGSMINVAAG